VAKRKVIFRPAIIILLLTTLFFLVLPYPFKVNRWSCVEPCSKVTDYNMDQKTEWSWLGGYHIVPDRFLPKGSGEKLEMFISNYYGVTYGGVAGFGLVSLVSGVGTYLAGVWVAGKRRNNSPKRDEAGRDRAARHQH